jgi:glucose-6-phosphate isomerase
MTDPRTFKTLRSQALTRAWQGDAVSDICIDGFRLLRQHSQLPARSLQLLQDMASDILPPARYALYQGEQVNRSEQQAALHMALRATEPEQFLPATAAKDLCTARKHMLHIADCLHHGRSPAGDTITDIVHIGIGGSDLSARLLQGALTGDRYKGSDKLPQMHFMSGPELHWPALRSCLDPATTQVIVVSKSLGTVETLFNWNHLRAWQQMPELVVTAATDKATAMGIKPEQILPLWAWVGGRYSFASAASLTAAIAMGSARFKELLTGAENMDQHFMQQPLAENLPVQLALLDFWNHCIRRFPARGVFSYHPDLRLLSSWLQQLEMESNGKLVDQTGRPLQLPAAPLVFGGDGPQSQHAMFQLLHQGERDWPLELIGVIPKAGDHGMHLLLAQLLGQWESLELGDDSADPVLALPGQRPVTAMLLPNLNPCTLGKLLAAFEHKTFALACLIGCNPFDQWGVEAGKRATARIAAALTRDEQGKDAENKAAISSKLEKVMRWLQQAD